MLKAQDVYLSSLVYEDLPVMLKWINHYENVVFNTSYKPVHEQQHRAWFESITQRDDVVIFGIRLCENDILIGSCQLHSIHVIYRHAEFQIRLGDVTQQEKGFGTQATKLLVNYAFQDLNLQRIYLHVFETNERAIHLYQKIGFVQEGMLRKHAYINGQYINVIQMGLLKDEWKGI